MTCAVALRFKSRSLLRVRVRSAISIQIVISVWNCKWKFYKNAVYKLENTATCLDIQKFCLPRKIRVFNTLNTSSHLLTGHWTFIRNSENHTLVCIIAFENHNRPSHESYYVCSTARKTGCLTPAYMLIIYTNNI